MSVMVTWQQVKELMKRFFRVLGRNQPHDLCNAGRTPKPLSYKGARQCDLNGVECTCALMSSVHFSITKEYLQIIEMGGRGFDS